MEFLLIIKFLQHVLQLDQGGLTLTSREQYLNKVFNIMRNFNRFLINFPKTPDNDTVLAALLEVMVETSMMLFRCFFNLLKSFDI